MYFQHIKSKRQIFESEIENINSKGSEREEEEEVKERRTFGGFGRQHPVATEMAIHRLIT